MSIPDQKELTQAARGDVSARFILAEALALGNRVGCALDGSELVLAPMRVPRETRRQLERELFRYQAEVIDIILRENAGRLS